MKAMPNLIARAGRWAVCGTLVLVNLLCVGGDCDDAGLDRGMYGD